jgi:ribosomal protein L7/L12
MMPPDDIEFTKLKERVDALERQVEFLLARSQLQPAAGSSPLLYTEVIELKRQGKLIDAIKLYRSMTNLGLAEAKQFVDNLEV